MKKNLLSILAALLAWGGWAAPAGAQGEGFYLTPKLGVSFFSGENRFDSDNPADNHVAKRGRSTSFAGALAMGYDFADHGAPIRTELEFTMRAPFETEEGGDNAALGHYTNRQRANINTLMFNAYVDFENDSTFTPYIGAGLGVAFTKGKNRYTLKNDEFGYIYYDGLVQFEESAGTSRETSTNQRKLAWSLAGGGAVALTDNLSLDLGYRYFHFGNLNMGNHTRSTVYRTVADPGNDPDTKVIAVQGNDPSGKAYSKRSDLHEVMLGLRFTYW